MPNKLSAVIITLNESKNIERCILSLVDVVDEIVVIDSFSTDNTVALAKSLGAVVFQEKWQGYSATKNFGHQKANSDYVLSIDADEALSDKLKSSILNWKSKGLSGVYRMNRINNYCGKWIKHCGWYPDSKIRVFPRKTCFWEGMVHEKLVCNPEQKETFLKGDLLHYSHFSSLEHRQKSDKYALLKAEEMHQNGKKSSIIKPFASAVFRFFSMYILKLGFLDGAAGFEICYISATSNYLKYAKLNQLNSEKN